MANQAAEILLRLKDARWRENLSAMLSEISAYTQAYYQGETQSMEHAKGDWDTSFCAAQDIVGHLDDQFRKLMAGFPRPRVVTASELYAAFEKLIGVPPIGHLDDIYDEFLSHVEHFLLNHRTLGPTAVCEVTDLPSNETRSSEDLLSVLLAGIEIGKAEILGQAAASVPPATTSPGESPPEEGLVFWAGNGVELVFDSLQAGWRSRSLEGHADASPRRATLHVRLQGRVSEKAATRLLQELLPIIQSLVRSVGELGAGHRWSQSSLPSISIAELRDYAPFVGSCSKLIYEGISTRDKMDRRLSIAVGLLADSDGQTSEAIRLALCVAALEALLGEKGAELAYTLADRVAVLLEPELEKRAAAFDLVKRLYTSRSEVLHGSSIEGQRDEADRARKLAAGVLYAVWSQCGIQRRMGQNPYTPESFFKGLRVHKWGQLPDSIVRLPGVRSLWAGAANNPGT